MQKYAVVYVKYAELYILHILHLYALPTLLMEWERKAIKAEASPWLLYFQWLAVMAMPLARTGQNPPDPSLARMFHYIEIYYQMFVIDCSILSIISI